MKIEGITGLISEKYGEEAIVAVKEKASPSAIELNVKYFKEALSTLNKSEKTYFDMLSCITGLDNGPEVNTMEVIYNLYSIPYNLQLMVYVTLDRNKPQIPTVSDIWKTADWHEREAYDLFGIHFQDHPDLRRILLPADWEGHPLKKDYEHQQYYHGIKVEY